MEERRQGTTCPRPPTYHYARTNVAGVGGVFNDTRKVKVFSLTETIKEKSTFRELVFPTKGPRSKVHLSFIVSGGERTFTFRVTFEK